MNDLEFTTRTGTTCDTCRRPTEVGFYHLHKGTPVLFDCVGCAERLVGKGPIDAALVIAFEVALAGSRRRSPPPDGESMQRR